MTDPVTLHPISPVDGIEEMTRIVYKLIEGWNRR